jgi:N4-gp56 family major capsid protein
MTMKMQKIQELGDTTTTDVRGSAYSGYNLEVARWEKEIIDAAQKAQYFAPFAKQFDAEPGTKDIVAPIRSQYGLSWGSSTPGEGVAVNYTDLANLDAVVLTPADASYGVAISNRALRVNALNLVQQAKEEMTYQAGDVVDIAVATALKGATAATSTVKGAQTIYGGDARSDAELVAGDIFTTDMVADAKTKLQSTTCKYWNPASPAAEAVSSATKNPWRNDPSEPFVLVVSPEQENVLLKDSQFVNAAEYGDRQVIMNGEIGSYLGIKIVVSSNTPHVAAGGTSPDGTGVVTPAVDRCMMFKANKAVGLAWGQRPKLYAFDFPSELEQRLILELAYQAKVLHTDATVFIDVASA